ncbi:MAG: hypothetical protein JRF52_11155 [Deltaproteobacteria bacterium]|nr:hypothetical protein [Deltaproteobacteria bacterium]
MTIETVRAVFFFFFVINIGLLIWGYLFFTLAHDWTYRYHKKWFKNLSIDTFDAMHYAGMGLFKIGILLFSLVPYFALRIVG